MFAFNFNLHTSHASRLYIYLVFFFCLSGKCMKQSIMMMKGLALSISYMIWIHFRLWIKYDVTWHDVMAKTKMEIKSNSKLTYLFYMYERSKWCRSVKMRLFTLLLPDAIKSNCNKSKYSRKNIFQICGKFATPSTSSNSNKENIADKLSMPFLVDSYESSFVNGGPKRLWRNRFFYDIRHREYE